MMRMGIRRWCLGATLALGAVLTWGHGRALAQFQQTSAAIPPGWDAGRVAKDNKIYAKKYTFRMPIEIEESLRGQLKEVRLYVKAANADWVQQEVADPSVKFFTYRVAQDGEYWFSVATVDRMGKMSPADLNKEPPGLQVVVDCQPPVLELKPWTAPDGETCLLCTMQDANPDMQSIRITYLGSDGVEHALEPHMFKAGLFRVPAELWGGKVHVTAADKCGNRAVRDMQITSTGGTPNFLSTTGASTPPPTAVVKTGENNMVKAGENNMVSNASPAPSPINPALDKMANGPGPTNITPAPSSDGPSGLSESESFPPPPPPLPPQTKPMPPAPTSNVAKQVLNTTRASMDYRIDQVGPSGVGKVEIWITPDQGQTWQRLGEDADRHSPADIDLPGDGLFGIRLVITNGSGFGGSPPARGDQPSAWIEVDTTPPFVQLREVDPITEGGALTIHWTAKDKNLASEPVNLYYRSRPEGTWQVVARGLKNDGAYRWTFPHNVGSQFYFKIEVADQAGNVGTVETNNPVALDMVEPRASVLGITGIRPR